MQAQLDLFAHSRDVMLRNDLIDALTARDAAAAQRALDTLAAEFPADTAVTGAPCLVAALAAPAAAPLADAAAAAAAVSAMEQQLTPAATQVLGAVAATAWLRPCWRELARRAAPLRFDAEQAHSHAAALWLRAADGAEAATAVESIASWRRIPVPLAWMAQARWQSLGADAGWPLLAELAWLAPRRVPGLLRSVSDPRLQKLVLRFEADFAADLDLQSQPETWAWLPAWALTHEPLLAQPMSGAGRSADGAPHQAFALMQSLLRLERQGRHHDIVEARQRLRGLSPELFAAYMRPR